MADIKTLVEEAKQSALSIFGEGDVRSDLRDLNEAIDALAALAEAHQAEVARLTMERDAAFAMSRCECSTDEACANLARLTRELQAASALLKFTPPVCNDIYTVDDRGVSFGKRAKALRVSIDAALAGASGAQP